MIAATLLLAVGFLGYANGANDNFKGVASLYGSRTLSYRTALALATAATAAGSICALFLASSLLEIFSGRGLVPEHIVESRHFLTAVAGGAGGTVMLASMTGFPISTTHALLGALVGAGFFAAGAQVNLDALHRHFILPLLLSPLAAVALALAVYVPLRALGAQVRIPGRSCVCVGPVQSLITLTEPDTGYRAAPMTAVAVTVDTESVCAERYAKRLLAIDMRHVIDAAHIVSAALVSFARGLNDTPKIAALLVGFAAVEARASMALVACAIAVGGVLGARRVAETMSHRITVIDHGHGLAANATTSLLVIAASVSGLPVSTTHVSVGALFGIGIATRQAHIGIIFAILGSWLLTLPCAAALSATAYWALS
jgi:inorganic phosphate transporter, PiT family